MLLYSVHDCLASFRLRRSVSQEARRGHLGIWNDQPKKHRNTTVRLVFRPSPKNNFGATIFWCPLLSFLIHNGFGGSNLKNRNEATDPSIGPNFPISVWSPSRLENCFLMLASSLPKKAKKRRGLILVMFESVCKNRSILLFGCFLFFGGFMKLKKHTSWWNPWDLHGGHHLKLFRLVRSCQQKKQHEMCDKRQVRHVEFLRGVGSEREHSCSFEDAHGRKW